MSDTPGTSAEDGPPATAALLTKDKKEPVQEGQKETEGQETNKGRKYMKRTTLVVLLGILNVFLLAILIFIIAFFAKDKSQRVTINPSKTFCLPCDEIKIHPDDDAANFEFFAKREENGKEICCADDGEHLDKMMDLYVERKHAIKTAESNTQKLEAACDKKVDDFEPRIMARVAGIDGTKPNGIYHVVNWKQAESLSFKQNITFDSAHNDFVVKQPGYYYIYSQVTLKIDTDTQNHGESMCHYIYRTRGGIPAKLLENSRTRCKFQGTESKSTSYIGAVFSLDKDDRIMVKVSHDNILDRMEPNQPKNYFGLHII